MASIPMMNAINTPRHRRSLGRLCENNDKMPSSKDQTYQVEHVYTDECAEDSICVYTVYNTLAAVHVYIHIYKGSMGMREVP